MEKEFQCPGLEDARPGVGELRLGKKAFKESSFMYKAAQMNRENKDSIFIRVPINYNEELIAFGGKVHWTGENYLMDGYKYNDIKEIEEILDIQYDREKFSTVLGCIEQADDKDNVVLCVQGPFSVLCSLINFVTVARNLKKEQELIEKVILHISDILSQYIQDALEMNVKMISLADPSGSIYVLGESKFKRFCGEPLIRLIHSIEPKLDNTCIHLCGKNCIDLKKCGLLAPHSIAYHGTYGNGLMTVSEKQHVTLIGDGCIHCENRTVDSIHEMQIVG